MKVFKETRNVGRTSVREQVWGAHTPPPKKVQLMELYPQVGNLFEGIGKMKNDVEQLGSALDQIRDIMERIRKIVVASGSDDFFEALLSRLESLLILIVDCTRRENLLDCLLPMIQYVKSWAPTKSIALKIVRILTKVLSEDVQGEQIDVPSALEGQGGWFSENWQRLTEGNFGKRLAGAVNLLIIAGICPAKASNQLNDEVYKALNVQAMRKQHPSIFYHIFSTIDWVVDSVVPALMTNNLSLLLYDSDYHEIDEMYRNCIKMVQMNMSGQMEVVEQEFGITSEADMIVYIIKTSAAHLAIKNRCKNDASMTREMQSRLIRLDKLQVDLQAFWHSKGLRTKPLGVLIRGPSSVGKSTLAGIVCHTVSRAMKFPEGKEYTVTLNGSDKYQSEFRSQHVCVIFDDVGNTKPERCSENPLFILIQFINNMHCSALSPEAEKKGKMDIRSKLVVVTTNTKDLHASFFSINPTSIMRRFDHVVDVKLKPDAVSSTGGLHRKFARETHPDAWEISLKEVVIMRSSNDALADNYCLKPVMETDLFGFVDHLAATVPEYFETQDAIVESSSEMHLREHCVDHPMYCLPCPKCTRGDPFVSCAQREAYICESKDELDGQTGMMSPLIASPQLQDEFLRCYMAEEKFDALTTEENDCEMSLRQRIDHICGLSVAKLTDLTTAMKKKFEQEPWMCVVAGVATVGMTGFALHRLMEPKLEPEGAVLTRIKNAASTPAEFVEKDNKYQKVYTNRFVAPTGSVSTTLHQLETKVDRNLNVVYIQQFNALTDEVYGKVQWCNSFPVGEGRWILVGHQFDDDQTYKLSFRTHPNIGVKRFNALVGPSNMRRLPNSDAVVVDLPQGGDTADFSKYMFDTLEGVELEKGMPLMVYHAHLSQVEDGADSYVPPSSYKITTKLKAIESRYVKGVGNFDLMMFEADNHSGMCGSMVFLAGRHPVLIGIHSAGNPSKRECGVTLLAKDMLSPSEGVRLAEESEMPSQLYDKVIDIQPDVHPFNPIHYIEDEDHNLEVYGQHNLPLSKFRTPMMESPMCESLVEHLGYERTHGAPTRKGVRPSRHRHLVEASRILPPSNPKYLKAAIMDFMMKLKPVAQNERFKEFVHPLDFDSAVNGTPGVKGQEPINPKTSMGFPLNSPKWKYFVQCGLAEELGLDTTKFVSRQEVDGVTQYVYEIKFDPSKADVEAETERVLSWFVDGKRANVVFRANLKANEAVTFKKIAQNKIRIFAGAPVSLVIITRMLTLPLINLMTHFPREFESAIGVDATGRDWQFIADTLLVHGKDRMGDGDFSSYDLWMRPEIIKGAFDVLRMCLEEASFDDELLRIFDGLATECMCPIYESDGLIVKMFGSNPSGHSLTVVINGLANGIYMRYAYYAMYDADYGNIPMFHTRVALLTYGDDNVFSVSPEEERFSMMSVGQQLARIGLKYTDATKNISTIPFKDIEHLSFLKRDFHVHPTFGVRVGALEKESIFKSLAMTRKPEKGQRETVAEICANNLNGALRELYYHDPDDYRSHIDVFRIIAQESVDNDGHRVSDYFTPILEEEIVAMFEKTKSTYQLAQDVLYGQVGEVRHAFPHSLEEIRNSVLNVRGSRHASGIFPYEWVLQLAFASYARYITLYGNICVFGNCVPAANPFTIWETRTGPLLVAPVVRNRFDVDFRRYVYYEGPQCIGLLYAGDVRLDSDFAGDIAYYAANVRRKRGILRAISSQIEYLWLSREHPYYVPEVKDLKIVNIFNHYHRLMISQLLVRLFVRMPVELFSRISEYSRGPVKPCMNGWCTVNFPFDDFGKHLEIWDCPETMDNVISVWGLAELGLVPWDLGFEEV